jgi:hypothetical protein
MEELFLLKKAEKVGIMHLGSEVHEDPLAFKRVTNWPEASGDQP